MHQSAFGIAKSYGFAQGLSLLGRGFPPLVESWWCMEGWRCKTAGAGGREQEEGVVYIAFHLLISLQFTLCACFEITLCKTTWRNNHTCKTCVYLEIARNSSLCRAHIQEIKVGWFMAFYCTSWPLLMFSSLRNGKSCNLDFYCAVHQPSPQPPSFFFLSWENLLWV